MSTTNKFYRHSERNKPTKDVMAYAPIKNKLKKKDGMAEKSIILMTICNLEIKI